MKSKGDLYIMLPCVLTANFEETNLPVESEFSPNETNDFAKLFKNELFETAKYEFDNALSKRLKRFILGDIELVCKSDNREKPEIIGIQKAFVIITKLIDTEFCLVIIFIVDINVSLTHLLDQVSRGELKLLENNQETSFVESELMKKYGIKPTGKAFFTSCLLNFDKEDKEAKYIIAGEAFNNDENHFIQSEKINSLLDMNHKQYSSYDAYMSERGVTIILQESEKNNFYSERLKIECLTIFIMELVILKITAINAANNEIIESFSEKDESKINIQKINEQFSTALPLWDIRHFRYILAQEFANRVETAFNVTRFINEYEKNRKFLEQLINNKKMIISENEETVIRRFAIVLSILQAIPFLTKIIISILAKTIDVLQILALFASSTITLTVIFLLFRKSKIQKSNQALLS